MPPVRINSIQDGIDLVTAYGGWNVSKIDMEDRIAGVAGNLKKKEDKFNEWLQFQEPFAHTYPRTSWDADHRLREDPPDLRVYEFYDSGDDTITVINFWIAVHLFDDNPLSFTIRTQNRELGPISGEWW